MGSNSGREPMLDMFIFETLELLDQLEQLILNSEKINSFETEEINEIFRIMHTIKGSAAMMFLNNISVIAHAMEDLFYYLREFEPAIMDYSKLCDLVLKGIDFIKGEVAKIESEQSADGDPSSLLDDINAYLISIRANGSSYSNENSSIAAIAVELGWESDPLPSSNDVFGEKEYRASIIFEDGCEMENIRAFNIIHKLSELAHVIQYLPENIEDDDCISAIRQDGFKIIFTTNCNREEMESLFSSIAFIKSLEVVDIGKEIAESNSSNNEMEKGNPVKSEKDLDVNSSTPIKQNMISVQLNKLDQLLDLVGELVITETMVTKNPDLAKSQDLENFNKAARQHRKVINEIQDVVMSIRMVPLAGTFQKMNRIVRDMSKKLNKQIEIEINGEETEVDKNIIEHLSDPLMHLIRNAVDHGIEAADNRIAKGKPDVGKVKLEAKNEGGDVWITIKDDGAGLNKEKILKRAQEHGLISKPETELSDQEIFSFILLPGFSTNTEITEYSGRGVGMDVVAKNIEDIGGSVYVDSTIDMGTTVSLEIPLTLAIIDGMGIRVGNSIYTVPITAIRESFKPERDKVFSDPDGQEMIMVRGECFPVLRLHELFKISTSIQEIYDGIIMMVESDKRYVGIFADELLGEQQVVVKALPKYLKKIKGIGGCTLLGDGTSSLILDVAGLVNY